MQTTLLGLAIAFILALLTALIGPSFFDWNQFRPQFEAEATRILGTQVRVTGGMDARLLPVPSLRLQSIAVGGANDPARLSANRFDVEFSLGALMRGEVRATELTVTGFSVDIGLNERGQVDWSGIGNVDLRPLAIEKLNLTGRIALHDAASKTTLEVKDIAFSGDIRGTAGILRGDGNLTVGESRMPFRLNASSPAEQSGIRTRLTVDVAALPLTADLDGLVTLDARRPRFEGAFNLTRPVRQNSADTVSWRATTKLKADPSGAVFEQIELSAGADDGNVKLTGSGDMRFGALPFLRATLAAASLDGDRLLGATGAAATLLPRLGEALGVLPRLPFAADIATNIDQIMLAGRPVQDIGIELRTAGNAAAGNGWSVSRLDFRGPGATRVTLAGAFSAAQAQSPAAGFDGRINLVSTDPNAFANWLQGRGDGGQRGQRPLRLGGQLQLAPGRITLDSLNAEVDGGIVKGRFMLARPEKGSSRMEASLQADRLDLDAAIAMLKAAGTWRDGWPDEGQVALDIGRATTSGQEMKPFATAFSYDARRITLDRLRIGEASGVMLDGSGTFDRNAATGTLSLRAATPTVAQLAALIDPFAPQLAIRLTSLAKDDGPSKLILSLGLENDASKSDRVRARGSLGIEANAVKGTVTVNANPQAVVLRGFDLEALRQTSVALEGKLSSPRGRSLAGMLGVDRYFAADETPLTVEINANGAWSSSWRGTTKLTGASLDADVQGSIEPWAEPRAAALRVAVRRANIAPFVGASPDEPIVRDASFTSKLTVAGNRYAFDSIDGVIGGARVRGRAAVTVQDVKAVEGEIGIDRIDLAPVFSLAVGAANADPNAPLGPGWLSGWRGRLGFVALRAALPGGLELQSLNGSLHSDGEALSIDTLKAKIGGGEATGEVEARTGSAGLALTGQLHLVNVDTAALGYRGLSLPEGKLSLRASLASQGRSASALSLGVTGEGLAILSPVRLSALDIKAIDLAIAASDQAKTGDDAALRRLVEPALAQGSQSFDTAQFPFVIKDGRLRINATMLESQNARAVVSGGYDFAADQADYRATLTVLNRAGVGNSLPELQVFAAGPPGRMARAVDIAPLSSWLAIRAIDRETRRLEALERGTPPSVAAVPPSETAVEPKPATPGGSVPKPAEQTAPEFEPSPPLPRPRTPRVATPPVAPQAAMQPQAPALPPAIEIGPPPGTPRAARPRPPMPLTPPAARSNP